MTNTPYFDAYECQRQQNSRLRDCTINYENTTAILNLAGNISDIRYTVPSYNEVISNTSIQSHIIETPRYRLEKTYDTFIDFEGNPVRVLTDVTLEMRDMYTGNWTVV